MPTLGFSFSFLIILVGFFFAILLVGGLEKAVFQFGLRY